MMERLAWTVAIFLVILLALGLLRTLQRRGLRMSAPLLKRGQVSLILVVSSQCPVCPAQKQVIAQLCERYPQLRVLTIDAQTQPEQARALSVMTVPSTLLQAPDGVMAHINNGFVALGPLTRQVEQLMSRNGGSSHGK